MRRSGTGSSYGTGQNVCLRLNFMTLCQFHGLFALFSIQTLQEQKKKTSYLKYCLSHDMYTWPLTSTDKLLALSSVYYIGMKAFQMIVFTVVTLV